MFSKLARLRKKHQRHPDSPVFARLADMHLRQGKVGEALSLCEEGCKRFPYYVTGFQVLSKCFRAQGKLEEARSAMDRALRLEPDNPGGYVQLASIYRDLGIATLALKNLQQAASLDPLNEGLSQQIDQVNYQVRVEETKDEPKDWNPDAESTPAISLAKVEQVGSPELVSTAAEEIVEEQPESDLETVGETSTEVAVGPPTASEPVVEEHPTNGVGTFEEGLSEKTWPDEVEVDETDSVRAPDLSEEVEVDETDSVRAPDLSEEIEVDETDSVRAPDLSEEAETDSVRAPGLSEEAEVDGTDPGQAPGFVDEQREVAESAIEEEKDLQVEWEDLSDQGLPAEMLELGEDAEEAPALVDMEAEPVGEAPVSEETEEADLGLAPPPPGLAALASEVMGGGDSGEVPLAEEEEEELQEEKSEEAPVSSEAVSEVMSLTPFAKTEVPGLAPHDDQELLRLFQEIESDYSKMDTVEEEDASDDRKERISTGTLAEIYISQGQVHRAIEIYQKILAVEPDNEAIKQKLARLQ